MLHLVGLAVLVALTGVAAWQSRLQMGAVRRQQAQLVVVVGVCVGLLVTQYTTTPNTFPFTTWSLYSAPVSAESFYRVTVQIDGEDRGELPLASTAPTKSPRSYLWTLGGLASRAAAGDEHSRTVLEQALRAGAGSLADDAGAVATVSSCRVDEPTRGQPETCSVLVDVPLGGGT
ncbi:MAG TPA: hypothetical protein VNQ73_20895 [Ilumatobacter sp.]|nr:hypothetical protein [Ilumatobacter sp.]